MVLIVGAMWPLLSSGSPPPLVDLADGGTRSPPHTSMGSWKMKMPCRTIPAAHRLGRCANIITGEQSALPRVKPFKVGAMPRQHQFQPCEHLAGGALVCGTSLAAASAGVWPRIGSCGSS